MKGSNVKQNISDKKYKQKDEVNCKADKGRKRVLPYEQIRLLHEQGLTGTAIAKQLGLKSVSVNYALSKMGLGTGRKRHERKVRSDGRVWCLDCKKWMEASAFNRNSSVCRGCRYQRSVDKCNADFDRNLKIRWARLRSSAKGRGVHFTITVDQFKSKYVQQNARCYYDGSTDLDIKHGKGPVVDRLSADRLVPDGPYSDENVVFTTHSHNSMRKHMDPEVFRAKLLAEESTAMKNEKNAVIVI